MRRTLFSWCTRPAYSGVQRHLLAIRINGSLCGATGAVGLVRHGKVAQAGAAVALGVAAGLAAGTKHLPALCTMDSHKTPLLNSMQIDDITAIILDGYTIPLVPASLQAVIVGEAVRNVVAQLEDNPSITSSKFTQHFQDALDVGLTDELMDELVSDLNGVLDIPLLTEASEESLLR